MEITHNCNLDGCQQYLADIELDIVDNETLKNSAEDIVKQTQELSNTIDDFRGFFKPDKMIQSIYIKDILEDTQKIEIYSRELMQVVINLLNNSKDALA